MRETWQVWVNALFKSYGVIYLPWLPSKLPDEHSTDIRTSSRFLSRQRLSMMRVSVVVADVSELQRGVWVVSQVVDNHVHVA